MILNGKGKGSEHESNALTFIWLQNVFFRRITVIKMQYTIKSMRFQLITETTNLNKMGKE